MGGEVIVLRVAHAHLVLQHLHHRYDALAVAIYGDAVDALSQTVVVSLLHVVALVVGKVVDGVGILRLHALQRIFIRQFGVVYIHLRLPYLRSFLESVEHRHPQLQTYSV